MSQVEPGHHHQQTDVTINTVNSGALAQCQCPHSIPHAAPISREIQEQLFVA